MAVVIRLSRMGKKGERKFRVVVAEKRSRREGTPIESLGWYHKGNDTRMDVNKERFNYWVEKGAVPSPAVMKIMQ